MTEFSDCTEENISPAQSVSNVDVEITEESSDKYELLNFIDSELDQNKRYYHDCISELVLLQNDVYVVDLFKWRNSKPNSLLQALCSATLDEDDYRSIEKFHHGTITAEEFYLSKSFRNKTYENNDEYDGDQSGDEYENLFCNGEIKKAAELENNVLKRIATLKSNGLWCGSENINAGMAKSKLASFAPATELPRTKDHAQFLFAEINWLADDVVRERQWKKSSAKRIAQAAVKVCREREFRHLKAEREEVLRVRKICANVAKMIREWWRQMDKIVQAKHQVRLTVKRQRAMTSHLGSVLETTEQYTKWLTEDDDVPEVEAEKMSDAAVESDGEFKADSLNSTDDEETIAKEEQLPDEEVKNGVEEQNLLETEATIPLSDLLPADYFNHPYPESEEVLIKESDECKDKDDECKDKVAECKDKDAECKEKDAEFKVASSEEDEDDEETMAEQEKFEMAESGPNDNEKMEVEELEKDAELTIEELMKKYAENPPPFENPQTDTETGSTTDTGTDDETESTSSTSDVSAKSEDTPVADGDADDKENVSLVELIPEDERDTIASKKEEFFNMGNKENEIGENTTLQSLTAEAMNAQPDENCFKSETVKVSAPFLLYGELREYQLVGLNWLAAIYEKKLNGILADEMGLGKTIQTIAVLSHLACDLGIWGPHLIIVPTSVLLNWEMEFKKWCPCFKILTYYGTLKERKEKRKGWTKTNAFHVCITSYRLAIQDSIVFKRKKWRYLILDEAQNIKNFKSQRWQTLLTFNSQRRLLLTGTPLQNSLMELWSLMHFLMPNIFQSHREFQEWFASPLTGMIEGNNEFNEQLIKRLHRVLRPFLLRRLKADVEKQMPKKYEHVVMCRLSRRQRYLYDDFMSLSTTKDTLKSGQFLSVMNILMQLRKVCNHPDLFETRPITSPFTMDKNEITLSLPNLIVKSSYPNLVSLPGNHSDFCSMIGSASAFSNVDLDWLDKVGASFRLIGQMNNVAEMARDLPSFVAKRIHRSAPKRNMITMIDTISIEDGVMRDRGRLKPFSDLPCSNDPKAPRIFLPKHDVLKLDEEFGLKHGTASNPAAFQKAYPRLPPPVCYEPSVCEVNPILNEWDEGAPKSIIRSRQHSRLETLRRFQRVNERRCNPLSLNTGLKRSTIGDAMGGQSWSCQNNNHIGPDTVYALTKLVRSRRISSDSIKDSSSSGYVNCLRSVSAFPSQNVGDVWENTYDNMDLASGFHSVEVDSSGECVKFNKTDNPDKYLGPECPLSVGSSYLEESSCLRSLLLSPLDLFHKLSDIIPRFAFLVPNVMTSGISISSSNAELGLLSSTLENRVRDVLHPILPSVFQNSYNSLKKFSPSLLSYVMPKQLHYIYNQRFFQFPDPRLIQYDCGKLQRLDMLLRELKAGSHRVLIFTQMARMLDILEQFLAYHGYRYLRLDGTTKVEQRQVLMERFNQDTRIFAFILSTRSGGLGVNLTGADTVVFYDSDWNPTMDAQAQDRCHRIGQTRDVHIYRLTSERTVEENILRKANQKRFLSDIAIEKGKFTTAFFKQNTLSELFAEPSGIEDVAAERERMEESKRQAKEKENISPVKADSTVTTRSGRRIKWRGDPIKTSNDAESNKPDKVTNENISETQLAAALEACEDENDRLAAKRAMEEVQADLDEFDEAVVVDENGERIVKDVDPLSRFARQHKVQTDQDKQAEDDEVLDPEKEAELAAEKELEAFEAQLTPIERFGVLHATYGRNEMLSDELYLEEAKLEESKKSWKLDQMKALREADEERAEIEEDDILYCHGKYDPVQRLAELNKLERELLLEQAISDDNEDDLTPEPIETENVIPKNSRGRPRTKLNTQVDFNETIDNKPTYESGDESDEEYSFYGDYEDEQWPIPSSAPTTAQAYRSRNGMDTCNVPSKSSNKRKTTYEKYDDSDVFNDDNWFKDFEDIDMDLGGDSGIPRCGGRGRLPITQQKRKRAPKQISERHGGHSGGIEDDFVYYDSRFKKPAKASRMNRMVKLHDDVESDDCKIMDLENVSKIGQKRVNLNGEMYDFHHHFPHKKSRVMNKPSTSRMQSDITKFLSSKPVDLSRPVMIKSNSSLSNACSYNSVNYDQKATFTKPLCLPVKTVLGKKPTNVLAQQVLKQSGQPVFIVTREVKTSQGKVFQQRFTHPVQPVPEFNKAVNDMHSFLDKIHPSLNMKYTPPVNSPNVTKIHSVNHQFSKSPPSQLPSDPVRKIPTLVHIPPSYNKFPGAEPPPNKPTVTVTTHPPIKKVVPIIQPVTDPLQFTPGGVRLISVNSNPQVRTIPANSPYIVKTKTQSQFIKIKPPTVISPSEVSNKMPTPCNNVVNTKSSHPVFRVFTKTSSVPNSSTLPPDNDSKQHILSSTSNVGKQIFIKSSNPNPSV